MKRLPIAALIVVGLPVGTVTGLLGRFVLTGAIGIAMNLLPFVGLDGSLLVADLLRIPDLRQRAGRAAADALSGERNELGRRWPYVAYLGANAVVAALLLAAAAFFWFQLFGRLLFSAWAAESEVPNSSWSVCPPVSINGWEVSE